jgi:hypothetical protein
MLAARFLARFAVIVLGLSAGAMFTEAVVFVDYWRSLSPAEFLDWFGKNEPALVAFYGPLQTSALILTVLATLAHAFPRRSGLAEWIAATALSIAVLAMYAAYFKDVNASFVARSIGVSEVSAELRTWAAWQWVRTGVGTGAFLAGLLAVVRAAGSLDVVRSARSTR